MIASGVEPKTTRKSAIKLFQIYHFLKQLIVLSPYILISEGKSSGLNQSSSANDASVNFLRERRIYFPSAEAAKVPSGRYNSPVPSKIRPLSLVIRPTTFNSTL